MEETQPSNNSTQVNIHPLAIIGISDHQTRITTGGGKTSPLSSPSISTNASSVTHKTSQSNSIPIIGLLFGYKNGVSITIVDAEEVEYPDDQSDDDDEKHQTIQTKIELHQKVFPMHQVVGWYRVDLSRHPALVGVGENGGEEKDDSNDDDDMVLPSELDLIIHNGWMKKYNQSPLFVLMDGNERPKNDDHRETDANIAIVPGTTQNESSHSKNDGSMDNEKEPKKKKNNLEDAREKLDREEQLPIAIYESSSTIDGSNTTAAGVGGGMVFLNLDFELETFEPERIAVEKVLQTQPKKNTTSSSIVNKNDESSSNADTSNVKNEKNNLTSNSSTTTTTAAAAVTQSEVQIHSLISSIEAMNTRIAVLLDFLQKTQSGEIPPNYVLLRQVQSLIHQLPLVMGNSHLLDRSATSQTISYTSEEKIPNEKLFMEFENEYDDMLIVTFLATIAKTTKAVLGYSEKFKVVSDSKAKDYGKSRYGHFKDDL